MVTLKWCKKQKKGINLIEPNDNLALEYIKTAEETLDTLKGIKNKSKIWLATTKYYCEYFAFYSLLMKVGIKCEIHDCTVLICKILEKKKIVPDGYSKILEDDKTLRIDNQYYLKNREVPINYDKLLEYVMTIKNITLKLTNQQISEIRKMISNIS